MNGNRLKPKFECNKRLLELLIHEIFLPKKLPDSYNASKPNEHESQMLCLMDDIIQELNCFLPRSTCNLFRTWSFLQSRSYLEARDLQTAIASLQNGEMLGLYIHKQNCAFCLYVPHDDNCKNKAIVSTFPVSLENTLIMSNINDLQVRASL